MLPKEKAVDLVNKFKSKTNALIAVDEIINVANSERTEFLGHMVDEGYAVEYFNEVKKEILNIKNGDITENSRYFLIRRYASVGYAFGDVIGFTDNEDYAKSRQSVFCSYEEIKYINSDGEED